MSVSLHVRRTDKIGTEAGFHNLSEYMIHIDDFYRRSQLSGTESKRRVYLATDDPSVWRECRQEYPNYEFVGNQKASLSASKINTRYKSSSLMDLLIDIYLLSETDYLVCTMSSNVSDSCSQIWFQVLLTTQRCVASPSSSCRPVSPTVV